MKKTKRWGRFSAALLMMVLTIAILPAVAFASTVPEELANTSEEEWTILRLTNVERANGGLNLLVTFPTLQKAAGIRSDELLEVYSHTRPGGLQPDTVFAEVGVPARMTAENIAMGHGSSEMVVEAWMDSPGHNANILTAAHRYLGMGYTAQGKAWVQLFGSSNNSECKSITFDEKLGYFTLELKNGITAYAPYDPASSPRVNGKVTFQYPGAEQREISIKAQKHPFTDVKTGSYYENAVVWALNKNVTSGTSATTFSPNATCTRGQVVTFLWNAQGRPEPTSKKNPFTDVKSEDWFYKPVLWAVEKGITSGTGAAAFSPNATCTSGQVITLLWNAGGKPEAEGTGSLAAQYPGQWYTNAAAWADGAGLFSGIAFAPEGPSTRADIVTYLYRSAGSPAI